jgi:F-type H+-transporting ATPase subunit alpha
VPRFQEELREYLRTEGGVYAGIRDSGDFPDDAQAAAREQIAEFRTNFAVHEEASVAGAGV